MLMNVRSLKDNKRMKTYSYDLLSGIEQCNDKPEEKCREDYQEQGIFVFSRSDCRKVTQRLGYSVERIEW